MYAHSPCRLFNNRKRFPLSGMLETDLFPSRCKRSSLWKIFAITVVGEIGVKSLRSVETAPLVSRASGYNSLQISQWKTSSSDLASPFYGLSKTSPLLVGTQILGPLLVKFYVFLLFCSLRENGGEGGLRGELLCLFFFFFFCLLPFAFP